MKTATFIKNVNHNQQLFKLSESIPYDFDYETDKYKSETNYIITSAVVALVSGPETYIFPAGENGEILDWGELEGSYRGGLDHRQALENGGWDVVND